MAVANDTFVDDVVVHHQTNEYGVYHYETYLYDSKSFVDICVDMGLDKTDCHTQISLL